MTNTLGGCQQLEEAAHSVSRIAKKGSTVSPRDTVAMMVRTNEFEIATTAGASYLDCFKGTDLRRTEIACVSILLLDTRRIACSLYLACTFLN